MALYSRKRARRSLFDTVIYRAISQIVTILSYIVIVRGMTEHDFGIFNLLYAFIPVLSTVGSFGLEQTLRRYQPEYLRSGNQSAAAWLVRFISSARLGSNLLLIAIVLLTWNVAAPLFKLTPYRVQFIWFCVLILLHFQSRILQLTLASHMLHRYSVGSMVILSAGKLVAYLILIWRHDLTLQNAILADTAAYALAYVFLKIAHIRYCRPPPSAVPFRPDAQERKRFLRYGFYNNFNDYGSLVLTSRSDNFFIAALVDPIAVGAYAFYVRLNEMTAHFRPTKLFENIIQPVFFAIPPDEADRRIPRYFSLMVNMNLLVQLPIAAYATAFHAEIVQVLFGGKFLDQSLLLPVIVGFATTQVVAIPATLVAQYAERPTILLYSKVFAIYNVAAMLLLLPVAGLYGAAIATGTAQLMKNVFIWWFVRRTARWTNWRAVVGATILIWGGVVAACWALKTALHGPPIFNLLCGVLVCGAAWLLYVRSPAISKSDREILGGVLHGREARLLRWVGVLPRPALS